MSQGTYALMRHTVHTDEIDDLWQTESPLLIRPYLKDLTKSEIHAVMTGGFATIAGSVMGAFINFGVSHCYLTSLPSHYLLATC